MLGSSSRRSKLSCLACQPLHHKLWLDFLASGSRQGRLLATCEGEIARCIYQHSLHPSTPRALLIKQPAEYSQRGSWRSSLLTKTNTHLSDPISIRPPDSLADRRRHLKRHPATSPPFDRPYFITYHLSSLPLPANLPTSLAGPLPFNQGLLSLKGSLDRSMYN